MRHEAETKGRFCCNFLDISLWLVRCRLHFLAIIIWQKKLIWKWLENVRDRCKHPSVQKTLRIICDFYHSLSLKHGEQTQCTLIYLRLLILEARGCERWRFSVLEARRPRKGATEPAPAFAKAAAAARWAETTAHIIKRRAHPVLNQQFVPDYFTVF